MSLTKVSYSMINGDIVNVFDYGFSESASGADNQAAFQAACDAASVGSLQTVFIPSGNYNLTGTVDTKGCPLMGEGSNKTVLFPTTSEVAIKVTSFGHGIIQGLGINFTNVGAINITSSAVGFDLWDSSQCAYIDCLVTRAYHGWRLLSTNGVGTTWQTDFNNCIGNYCKYEAFYFDSATDSTTLKFSNCHVYGVSAFNVAWSGGWDYYRGWYTNNVTSVVFSNCSMDGGGQAGGNGTIMNINNYQSVSIDTFHTESYTHVTGGTSYSPFNFEGSGKVNFGNLLMVAYTVYTDPAATAYVIRSAALSTIIGNIEELGTVVTSGAYKYMYSTGYPFFVQGADLSPSMFDRPPDGNEDRRKQTYDQFYWPGIKQVTTTDTISVSNAGYAAILSVAPLSGTATQKSSGLFIVSGNNSSLGIGWLDVIVLVAAWNGTTATAVVSTNNSGAAPTRTYQYNATTDAIEVTTNSATVYGVTAYGTQMSQRWW